MPTALVGRFTPLEVGSIRLLRAVPALPPLPLIGCKAGNVAFAEA
jgi:hypothetical protein